MRAAPPWRSSSSASPAPERRRGRSLPRNELPACGDVPVVGLAAQPGAQAAAAPSPAAVPGGPAGGRGVPVRHGQPEVQGRELDGGDATRGAGGGRAGAGGHVDDDAGRGVGAGAGPAFADVLRDGGAAALLPPVSRRALLHYKLARGLFGAAV